MSRARRAQRAPFRTATLGALIAACVAAVLVPSAMSASNRPPATPALTGADAASTTYEYYGAAAGLGIPRSAIGDDAPWLMPVDGDDGAVDSTDTITFTYTGTGAATSAKAGGQAAAAAGSVITCWHSIHYPHKSSHAAATANVVSDVSCMVPMTYLQLDTKLYRSGILVGTGRSSKTGFSWLKGNAAAPCRNSLYWGTSAAVLRPPWGYQPSYLTNTKNNRQAIPVYC